MIFYPQIRINQLKTSHTISPNRSISLAFAAGFVLYGCTLTHRAAAASDQAYQNAVAEAKKAGLPVSTSELARPMPPPSENAALIYTQMLSTLKDSPLSEQDEILDTYCSEMSPSSADTAQATAALSRRADLMALVHQAAAIPGCVFERDWSAKNPAAIMLPEYAQVREAARFLSSESQVMAHNGQGVAAVHNEALGFRLAKHAGSDGMAIGFQVEMAIDQITMRALQKIMITSDGDGKVAQAVEEVIDSNWTAPLIAPTFRKETAFEIGMIEAFRSLGPSALGDLGNGEFKPATDVLAKLPSSEWNDALNRSGVYLLSALGKVIKAADLPFPTAFAREQAIEMAAANEDPTPRRLICQMLLVKASAIVSKRAILLANARATRAGAAVLSYKAAHGALPKTLAAAVTPAPIDPFDLKPLRYRQEGDGFVIYSAGPTLHYDGGTPDQPVDKDESAFRYPAAT